MSSSVATRRITLPKRPVVSNSFSLGAVQCGQSIDGGSARRTNQNVNATAVPSQPRRGRNADFVEGLQIEALW
jgi:hypothetical protein